MALDDLESAVDHLAVEHGLAPALNLHEKVVARVGSLSRHPMRCRVVPELKAAGVTVYRELIIPPYRIIFRVDEDIVGVAAFLDGRRDLDELLVLRGFLLRDR